jgi:hypothetical protein
MRYALSQEMRLRLLTTSCVRIVMVYSQQSSYGFWSIVIRSYRERR